MLNEHEQRLWDEIERNYRAGADGDGERKDLPAPIIGGAWAAVMLVVFGVPAAGAAIAGATALIWLLWRFLPQLEAGPADEPVTAPSRTRLPAIRWSDDQH